MTWYWIAAALAAVAVVAAVVVLGLRARRRCKPRRDDMYPLW